MSSNALNANQSQYERKAARQRQLDMMEAAASGQDCGPAPGASPACSTLSRGSHTRTHQHQPPEGAIENARRFLWDEDDVQAGHDTTHVILMGRGTPSPLSSGGGIARSISAMIPRFTARTGMENEVPVNLPPRRSSTWSAHGDAMSRSTECEEFMGQSERVTIVAYIGDTCLAIFHTVVGLCAILAECVTGCIAGMNLKLMSMLCLGSMGLGLFIFGIVAIVHRATTGSSTSSSTVPIEDEVRYHAIRNSIIDSTFTAQEHLDARGTAQNLALRWMTDFDPAQLATDHAALLQRYALAVFYFSTYLNAELHDQKASVSNKEGGWVQQDNWMTEKGICEWYGVTCPQRVQEGTKISQYNENSDIVKLNLTDNNVVGTIPSELVAFENLISLDLGNNIISGTIPKALFGMKLLNELYLEGNDLVGTIHTEIGSLVAIRDLFFGTNKLTGPIPSEIGKLTTLRALGLDENFLTGTIPNLWTCTQLLIVYLDNNLLKGTIPAEIMSLKELIDLRLRKNAFVGSIPESIQKLVHLELFYVDSNELTGTIPNVWNLMPRIQEIQVYKNKLVGTLPDTFSTLNDLRIVYADNNALNGTLPSSYGLLNDLETFYVFNNQLKGKIPTEYGNIDNLRDVQMYNNKLTGHIPSEIGKNYKLLKLEVHENALSGTIPTEFGQLESLQMLKLYRNKLTGSVPASVCTLKDKFDLSFLATDCNIKGEGTLQCNCCNACYP